MEMTWILGQGVEGMEGMSSFVHEEQSVVSRKKVYTETMILFQLVLPGLFATFGLV